VSRSQPCELRFSASSLSLRLPQSAQGRRKERKVVQCDTTVGKHLLAKNNFELVSAPNVLLNNLNVIVIINELNYVLIVRKLCFIVSVCHDDTFHIRIERGFGTFGAIFKYYTIGG
jgi:hypothetical protein